MNIFLFQFVVYMLLGIKSTQSQFTMIDLPSNVPSLLYYFIGSFGPRTSSTYFTYVRISEANELQLCHCAPPNGIRKVSGSSDSWDTCDFWSSWIRDISVECECGEVTIGEQTERLDTDYMLVCCDASASESGKLSFQNMLNLSTVRKLENQNCAFPTSEDVHKQLAVFGLQEILISDGSRINLLRESDFPHWTMHHHSLSQHLVFMSPESINNDVDLKAFSFVSDNSAEQLSDDVRDIITSSISPSSEVLITLLYS